MNSKVEEWEEGIKTAYVSAMERRLTGEGDLSDSEDDDSISSEHEATMDEANAPVKPTEPKKLVPRQITGGASESHYLDFVDYQGRPAFVWLCDKKTREECVKKMMFGAPFNSWDTYYDCGKGSIVYLYNFVDKEITGPCVAATNKGKHDPTAWGGRYPCQIRIKFFGQDDETRERGLIPRTMSLNDSKVKNILGDKRKDKKIYKFSREEQESMTELFAGTPRTNLVKSQRDEETRVNGINDKNRREYETAMRKYYQDLEDFEREKSEREQRTWENVAKKMERSENRAKGEKSCRVDPAHFDAFDSRFPPFASLLLVSSQLRRMCSRRFSSTWIDLTRVFPPTQCRLRSRLERRRVN